MFDRFVVLKPALLYMQGRQEYKDHHKSLLKIKERDWAVMGNVVNVLKVFYEITLQLSHASACISEVRFKNLTYSIIYFETQVLPCITMLARSLERTGGSDEDGVRMLKDELRDAVLKKNSNRLGDFEDYNFYVVSTLCDPRCN